MVSTKTKKILGDFKVYKNRYILMTVALAVSLFAIATMLSAYSILIREISSNYMDTNPAHVTFEVDQVDSSLLKRIRDLEVVKNVEKRDAILLQVKSKDNKWYGLRTFVISDFNNMELSRMYGESGSWPPEQGSVLFERTVPDLLGLGTGDSAVIKTAMGEEKILQITGIVHDPSLSPAWQEKTGYAYITPETMGFLTGSTILQDLKIVFNGDKLSHMEIKEKSALMADFLKNEGVEVSEILVPPPYKHPHQGQMETILSLFIIFGFLAIVLSSILAANMVSSLMAREIRQIGILKTIGADSLQITGLYLSSILVISILSLFLGLFPGISAGRYFATIISSLLNFTVNSTSIPTWVYSVLIGSGLLLPLLICLVPIIKGSRITVRQAISDKGLNAVILKDKGGKALSFLPSFLQMAFRNTYRKKYPLILSLLLLSTAGALFLSSKNVDLAWQRKLERSFESRNWDLELRLAKPVEQKQMEKILGSLDSVESFEAIQMKTVAPDSGNELKISETYPDGGHGVFYLKGIEEGSISFRFPIEDGQWLSGDSKGIILNQKAKEEFAQVNVGGVISLIVDNKVLNWNLEGVVEEIGPATAYFNADSRLSNSFLIRYSNSESLNEELLLKTLEEQLERNDIRLLMIIPESLFRSAINDHIYIIIYALLAMGIILAIVGVLGLSSSISTSILERRSEFGILKTIGGSNGKIILIVLVEAMFISILSIAVAVILSLPLSALIGNILGTMAFSTALSLFISMEGLLIWIGLLFISTILAALFPAVSAIEMTVQETLAYE